MKWFWLLGEQTLNRVVSHDPGVKGTISGEASGRGAVAKGVLASHRSSGHAHIKVLHGDVDSYVVLSDERGQWAAAAIEFGRREYTREIQDKHGKVRQVRVGAARGVGALRAAMG